MLVALKFLHLERKILFHGHEAMDTDSTPTLAGEAWLLRNGYTRAEGVANLDKVPEKGALVAFGFPKLREVREGMHVSSPSAHPIGNTHRGFRRGGAGKHRWLGGKSLFIGTPTQVRAFDKRAR